MRYFACIAGGVSLLIASSALAADTGQLPCKTTQECNESAAKIGANAPSSAQPSTSKSDAAEDQFYWLNKINKASTVMLMEEGIFPKDVGQLIAKGVDYTIRQAREPDGKRPSDVLQIEKIMTDKVGEEASVVHAGRSRQDMYATFRAAKLRNQTLDLAEALLGLRTRLLARAADNLETVMPGYTNGVQAVPITYGHYLLAYEESFERDQQRISDAWRRLNLSPMGVGVMSGSIWPLNRARLAELLGFDGIVENSMDANQVIPFDNQLEASAIANSAAIRIGVMMQDLHTQYAEVRPWLLLQEGSTYTSSAMPQKRNPGLIMQARIAASDVVGLSEAVSIRAHNVTSGMVDSKFEIEDLGLFPRAVRMVDAADRVFDAIVVDKARAREELESDWTSTMNLAELLLQSHQIPFRVGHGFASQMVSYARPLNLTPKTIPFDVVTDLFGKTLAKFNMPAQPFPMSEAEFREVMSPEWIVTHTKGVGGPQPAEAARMLKQARQRLDTDKAWLAAQRDKLAKADAALDQAFAALLPKDAAH
ncbi:argininosuccinate lyase [Bradyrhizobium jicamae]|uniref:argininosuccinate lyase n=1 Tax=Bradyrhizobium jicamae TaxID=280332 RepID=A0ABS5FAP7_9BRAD|nr:lyase family protein [Bradyrhizobium jicamae]MBR0793851.1 argininosuccinate lyase [Bradyrhizobium jicamae]MBR0933377.1 argininosuccinate lyase [Bradyrhizobium jicamae]